MTKKPDVTTLRRLYVDEKKSLAEIGRLYGVHRNQVRRWLLQAAIPTRSISEGTSLAQAGRPLSEKHKESLRKSIAEARSRITEDSHKKRGQKLRGRTAYNKGVPWTEEERQAHMAVRRSSEYREKLSEAKRGDKAPNWKGGVSRYPERLRTWKWREIRQQVYERDNWTCQDCGVHCQNTNQSRTKATVRIQCHHLVSRRDGGQDELDNLVTLCMSCHMKREWQERRAKESDPLAEVRCPTQSGASDHRS